MLIRHSQNYFLKTLLVHPSKLSIAMFQCDMIRKSITSNCYVHVTENCKNQTLFFFYINQKIIAHSLTIRFFVISLGECICCFREGDGNERSDLCCRGRRNNGNIY